jgi:hypothetical protein
MSLTNAGSQEKIHELYVSASLDQPEYVSILTEYRWEKSYYYIGRHFSRLFEKEKLKKGENDIRTNANRYPVISYSRNEMARLTWSTGKNFLRALCISRLSNHI